MEAALIPRICLVLDPLKGFSTHHTTRGDLSHSLLLIRLLLQKYLGLGKCFPNSDAEATFSFLNSCSHFPSDQRGNRARGNKRGTKPWGAKPGQGREEQPVWSLCLRATPICRLCGAEAWLALQLCKALSTFWTLRAVALIMTLARKSPTALSSVQSIFNLGLEGKQGGTPSHLSSQAVG